MRHHCLPVLLLALLPAGPAAATNLSERVANYDIEARLDPASKTVDGLEVLTYRNLTGRPLDRFPFHLYLNGFQPRATWFREYRRSSVRWSGEVEERHRGSIEVQSVEVVGTGKVAAEQMRFIQPDDGNPDDRTVLEIRLPKPVAPGASVQFRIKFRSKLPQVLARTGYGGDFFMVGQWFPKVGVWWKGTWNCHQFHANTEFFADFGEYNVKVRVPRQYVLGASGNQVSSVNNSDGTKTVTYRAEDVHDFAWAASPRFQVIEDRWPGASGRVAIHLLLSPGHAAYAPRYLHALKATLERFDQWYGAYPYDGITVVDPPQGAREGGGMEYPTLITAGMSAGMPRGLRLPEVVLEHEFGHQYWYGMVATNEFEEAWLDEGINSYTEAKVMDAIYGPGRSLLDLLGATAGDGRLLRGIYLLYPSADPMARFGYQYVNGSSYGAVTYGKTASVLLTLEGLVGEETMRRALRTWFERYRFKHPTGEDFLKTLQEVCGRDLNWYFSQAVYGTQVLDYAVEQVTSRPLGRGSRRYASMVLVRRKGEFVFPVQLEVKFENGEVVREQWDGKETWKRFEYADRARLVYAQLDPEGRVLLDKDIFNNSRRLEPDRHATRKLAGYWLIFLQLFAQVLTWLV